MIKQIHRNRDQQMSRKYPSYCVIWLNVLPIKKILFKNQRPPAEVAPAPSRGHPIIPPALLVVADLMTTARLLVSINLKSSNADGG